MAINPHLEAFLHAIASWSPAYTHSDVRFVAARLDGGLCLLKGRLFLRSIPLDVPPQFKSRRFVGGAFKLEDVGLDLKAFTEKLIEGVLLTPEGEIPLLANKQGVRPTNLTPFHEEGLQDQNRLPILSIHGGTRPDFVKHPDADWDVMASETPFYRFQELLNTYDLGFFEDDQCVFEVAALLAVAVDKASNVNGTDAELAIIMGERLDPNVASLGYRVLSNGVVVERRRVLGGDLQWSSANSPGILRGSHKTNVPNAAVVQCFANYAGETHHFWWFADPAMWENPRRAVYEITDPQLSVLQNFLSKPQGRGNARDLEVGVAWLLWMLGFSVAHLGATSLTQDAVDLVAVTPSGNLAVVECTTGLLKAENKLALLVARASRFREQIERTGQRFLRVLPVIVTSRTRDEISAEVEAAERLGVLVLSQENLLDALPRTLQLPDPERVYSEGERATVAAAAKYRTAE